MLIHSYGILARYILKQLIIPFACCFLGFMFLFFISDLQDELGDMLKKENQSTLEVIFYFLMVLPDKIPLVTPMSLLLGTMYCFANLNRHNEINAMRSSGISIFKLSIPVFIFTSFLSIAIFIVNEYFQKSFIAKAVELHEKLTGESNDSEDCSFTIGTNEGDRQWNLKFNKDHSFSRISLTSFGKNGNINWTIDAHKATFDPKNGWTFYNAIETKFNENNFPLAPYSAKVLTKPDINDDPYLMKDFTKLSSLTLQDIYKRKNSPVRFSEQNQQFMEVKFYSLIFSPFACLISVLIGIPLSITEQRQGALVSSGKALLIMIVYYVILQVFQNLGNSGIIPAFIAGSGPTLFFLISGLFVSLKK